MPAVLLFCLILTGLQPGVQGTLIKDVGPQLITLAIMHFR
jgi:hypothetical protein